LMSYHSDPAAPEVDDGPNGDLAYTEERPGRHLLRPILVVLVMALFAGGLWYAYDRARNRAPGDVPLIRADITATKTRPEQPGGMAVPDQDKLVYNQGRGQPQVEKLLPPPEAPLPRPVAVAEPAPARPVVESAPAPANLPADGTAAPIAPVVAPPPTTAAVPSPAAAQPSTAPPPGPTSAHPAVAALPPPRAPAIVSVGGGFRLQLGALRSEDEAKNEWSRIKQANKDLLGAYGAAWPRVDLGDRGIYYRLQAGPVSDGAAAERICGELKRRNVGCILVRP
jgi:cell division septation protein DedD